MLQLSKKNQYRLVLNYHLNHFQQQNQQLKLLLYLVYMAIRHLQQLFQNNHYQSYFEILNQLTYNLMLLDKKLLYLQISMNQLFLDQKHQPRLSLS